MHPAEAARGLGDAAHRLLDLFTQGISLVAVGVWIWWASLPLAPGFPVLGVFAKQFTDADFFAARPIAITTPIPAGKSAIVPGIGSSCCV